MTAPALSEFESLVQQVISAAGCSRERAVLAVAYSRPELQNDAMRSAKAAENENVLEKQEQHEIYKLFRGYGFKVWNLSQSRASKQTPGLPDAFATHKTLPIAFWWESKRQIGGKLSADQREFRERCLHAGVPHHYGNRNDAARLLTELGLARPGAGPCGIVPFHDGR